MLDDHDAPLSPEPSMTQGAERPALPADGAEERRARPATPGAGERPPRAEKPGPGTGGVAAWIDAVARGDVPEALAPLWRPRDLRPSPELAHAPLLFWLMAALRPRAPVVLGLGSGVAVHALAQAAERLALDAAVAVAARPGEAEALGPDHARAAEAAAAWHAVRVAEPGEAHRGVAGPVDLLCVLAPPTPALARALARDWPALLAPGAAVLAIGAAADALPKALAPRGRMVRMAHGGGLTLAVPDGAALPALMGLVAAPGGRRRRAAALFERLGAIWTDAAAARMAGPSGEPGGAALAAARRRADEALEALDERSRALAELRERLVALEAEHRLVCERRDTLWDAMREYERRRADADREAGHPAPPPFPSRSAQGNDGTGSESRTTRMRSSRSQADSLRSPQPGRNPWDEARTALMAAELDARRSRRFPLRDLRAGQGQPSTRKQIAAIRGSALFDPEWYLARYPDVVPIARSILGPIERGVALHYLRHGAIEGRDPGPGFSTRHYYVTHPDVARSGWNALVHYETFGRAEGRAVAQSDMTRIDLAEDIELIRCSGLFEPEWYAGRYGELPERIGPVEHYLTVGAQRGYDPGPRFSTRRYLEGYPDIARAGVNPLVHYLRHGRDEGRTPFGGSAARRAQREVAALRDLLLTRGFTQGPVAELEAAAQRPDDEHLRVQASLELGRWRLRDEGGPDPAAALRHLEAAARETADPVLRPRVALLRLAALHRLGRREEGLACLEEARREGFLTPDLLLARSMLEPEEGARIAAVNEAMRAHGLPEVALREPAAGAALYDRLRTAGEPPRVEDGPLVSVIVAAHDAERTLPLTLTALAEQTWRNHEVVVVDDASADGTRAVAERFAAADPRVRVMTLPRNVGAYAARNRGLAEARGELVTLQDADDWTHATRLETQARYLAARTDRIACTTQQARAREDLTFARWSVQGDLTFANTSSLTFWREPVMRELGGWDEVRFGADAEMIRRLRRAFGERAVQGIESGPMTLQRYTEASATGDPETGFNGAFKGARLEYLEAQRHHHARGGALRYEPGARPFPVPRIMRPDARRGEVRALDVVIASELRMKGGSTHSSIQEIRAQKAAGLTTGVVKMYRYDLKMAPGTETFEGVRETLDGEAVSMVEHGERVTCDLLILRYPPVLQHPQRYLPRIEPKRIKVIVNQPPMSDYGPEGERRYELAEAEANLRAAFGRPGEWHPIGPLVRDALHEHHADELGAIDLAKDDWTNIIDLPEWDRGLGGGPRASGGPLRIGRHARDNPVKWPATARDVLEVYPEAPDVEVHVLGGAKAPEVLIGRIPQNWRVEPFGSRAPQAFLSEIDVFVYYTHPGWVESFGRAIVEAMAVGVPVVLPPHYERVFGPAALYAPPSGAVDAARRLHADPGAYRAQARRAQDLVRERFGYELHIARLREAGVARA